MSKIPDIIDHFRTPAAVKYHCHELVDYDILSCISYGRRDIENYNSYRIPAAGPAVPLSIGDPQRNDIFTVKTKRIIHRDPVEVYIGIILIKYPGIIRYFDIIPTIVSIEIYKLELVHDIQVISDFGYGSFTVEDQNNH